MSDETAQTAQIEEIAETYVYDATVEQRVFIEVQDDESIFQYQQVYQPFNDSLVEYDKLRETMLSGDGNEQDLETASEVADNFFFEQNCIDLEGIDGEKPENWQAEIDLDERQAGIRRLLAVKVVKATADKPKTVKKRSFGTRAIAKNEIKLLSPFDGKEVETTIIFKDKRPSDISRYNRLKARIKLKEDKGFEDAKIKIPAQIKAKCELAGDIGFSCEGYRTGIVPMHHLALALTDYFDKTIKTNKKK